MKSVHCLTNVAGAASACGTAVSDWRPSCAAEAGCATRSTIFISNRSRSRPWSSSARIITGTSLPGAAELCRPGFNSSTVGGLSGSTVMRFNRGLGSLWPASLNNRTLYEPFFSKGMLTTSRLPSCSTPPDVSLALRFQIALGHRHRGVQPQFGHGVLGRFEVQAVLAEGVVLAAPDTPDNGTLTSTLSTTGFSRTPMA